MKDRITILQEAIQPKIEKAFSGQMGAAVARELAEACDDALAENPLTREGMATIPLGENIIAIMNGTDPENLYGGLLFKALPDHLIGKDLDDITPADLPPGPTTTVTFSSVASVDRLIGTLAELHAKMTADLAALESVTRPSRMKLNLYLASQRVSDDPADGYYSDSDASFEEFREEARNMVEAQAPVSEFRERGWDEFADFVIRERIEELRS